MRATSIRQSFIVKPFSKQMLLKMKKFVSVKDHVSPWAPTTVAQWICAIKDCLSNVMSLWHTLRTD